MYWLMEAQLVDIHQTGTTGQYCGSCNFLLFLCHNQVSAKCISLHIPVVHHTPSFSPPLSPTPTVPSFLCRYSSWTVWPWRWKHYSCSNCCELPTQQQNVTTQETWIFSSTTVRISDLINLIFCVTSCWKKKVHSYQNLQCRKLLACNSSKTYLHVFLVSWTVVTSN